MIRYLKIILVIFVGLQGFFYFAENIANWEAAKGFVSYVFSMEGHEAYPNPLLPPITSPALVTLALVVIVTGEFLVGALSLIGAFNMVAAAGKPQPAFEASKKFAILGCGMALIVWLGLFTVIGGALFGMWQTQLGDASLDGSLQYVLTSGIVMLFVAMKDD
ncbi:MAG: hypothetical protein CMI63_08195 [Parvularcula sp.]|nr:hypothetical protein [Parvularcula sp.]